jgi:hypothetical protein
VKIIKVKILKNEHSIMINKLFSIKSENVRKLIENKMCYMDYFMRNKLNSYSSEKPKLQRK